MKINVSIFGASGYTGTQLLSILINHKNVNISGVYGDKTSGKRLRDLFPYIKNIPDIMISSYEDFKASYCDLVFLCLPHQKSEIIIDKIKTLKVIDLSSDFRIKDEKHYFDWYNSKHPKPDLLSKFVYGLSELNRSKIKSSNLVANPGCYPTSILIPLLPLLKENIFSFNEVIIDSKSGLSGAGKSLSTDKLFFEVNENFIAYSIEKHRHLGEIKQEMQYYNNKINITFVPHLLPISRGILSSIYLHGNDEDFKKVKYFFETYFKNEKFVNFLNNENVASIKSVRGTNNLNFSLHQDFEKKKIIIISCIDNLIKGAAGQAIQNMNIMFGFNEDESLQLNQLSPL